jgi:tripeptidyl-peptidase-1
MITCWSQETNVSQSDPVLLEKSLRAISDPENARYGKHLGKDELAEIIKPSTAAKDAVLNWLNRSTIPENDIQMEGEWINFATTTQQANDMMDATFLNYQSTANDNTFVIRTKEVSLPGDIFPYVKLIHPTTHFSRPRQQKPQIQSFSIDGATDADPSCKSAITPKCLRDLYNIKGVTPDPTRSGFIGVAGFLGEYPTRTDLAQFVKENADWAQSANYTSSVLYGTQTSFLSVFETFG